jgi:DNA helicase-2/ATP-dependent DNA helicase PcrA
MALARNTFTDEQIDIITNFNDSALVWADPGTGKTSTVVAGLFMALHIYKIPPPRIYALSFTNVATSEMSSKFDTLAKRARISTPLVNFRTIHSLALRVVRDNYVALGMRSEPKIGDSSLKSIVQKLEAIAEDAGQVLEGDKVRSLAQAIISLNSALTFDEDSVTSKMAFKKLGMTYDDFTYYRYHIYKSNIRSKTIPRGETCLYALQVLESNPDISEKYKNDIELMVIDESQDMSLLQLRLASLLSRKLIIIGDIKQQIYAFNGACAEIVSEYKRLYPEAKEFKLTQSFRCGQKIADFATKIILPNKMGGEDFKGVSKNETVEIKAGLDYRTIIDQLSVDVKKNNGVLPVDVMFSCRNNVSLVPIIDKLYEERIPAQIPNYMPMNEVPIIGELAALVELGINPEYTDNGLILNKIIPDFSKYGQHSENPMMRVAREQGIPITGVKYQFRNNALGQKLMSDLMEVGEANRQRVPVSDLFNILWKSFNEIYLEYHKRYLEQEPAYYVNLVGLILKRRTYREFIDIEREKHNFFERCTRMMEGVKCFTFHSSKGMEADRVYLLDVDEGLLPNIKRMDQMVKARCELEAAVNLRNERNLLYVACTRAKTRLTIAYGREIAKLVMGESDYDFLDQIYETTNTRYDDIAYFLKFSQGDVRVN